MSNYIHNHIVTNVFLSNFKKIGTEYNYEQYEDGTLKKWEHFQIVLNDKFVNNTSRSIGDIQGDYRDTRNVFKRSLDEISMDALDTVLELINSNTLYRGQEWKPVLLEFKKIKKTYEKLSSEDERGLFAWENSVKVGTSIGRIRNHSIGTLLTNISEGMELDTAVRKYEQIVAPANYKRPKQFLQRRCSKMQRRQLPSLVIWNH